MTANAVRAELRSLSDPDKAAFYPRFFKAGPGEYAEGDRFLGVTVPKQRKIARHYRSLPLRSVRSLLRDPFHECRLTALLILVLQFERGAESERERTVRFYLEHLDFVNNWDLVDASAHKILGAWLENRDRSVLYELAASRQLWRQRIAMIATYHFIKRGDFEDTLALAAQLRDHEHDLIHKAVGWMLREVGNRDRVIEETFLAKHYRHMPRTMLRYAIEKFEPTHRKAYLARTLTTLAACLLLATSVAAQQKSSAANGPGFTSEQATAGRAEFERSCAPCHAPADGAERRAPPLSGLSFRSKWGDRRVRDLFVRMRDGMPPMGVRPRGNAYANILAFLLRENGRPAGVVPLDPLSYDRLALPARTVR